MKAINVLTWTKAANEKNVYEVPLGNGTLHRFSNLKEVKSFLAATNKLLNDILFEVNEVYSRLLQYHRNYYLLSVDFNFDRAVKSLLSDIDNGIEKAINLSTHTKSGNYYAFIHLRKAITAAKDLIKVFTNTYLVSKVHTMDRRSLEVLFSQVLRCETTLQTYGQLQACKIISISPYETLSTYEKLFKTA